MAIGISLVAAGAGAPPGPDARILRADATPKPIDRPTSVARLETAAAGLESATAPGGSGYRFDVVQRQVQFPSAGASDLPIVEASNPAVVARRVDHIYVNTVLAHGSVAPSAFWMEMRFGPNETTAPDYAAAPTMFQVILKNGTLWRNDGLGWTTTTVSPGVGMDPVTATRLPALLRGIASLTDQGTDASGGRAGRHYRGTVDVSLFPGVIASDGAAFTESPIVVDLWLDADGRLIVLEGRARNLNESSHDLRIVTRISFDWTAAGTAPDPSPLAPSPAASGVTVGVP